MSRAWGALPIYAHENKNAMIWSLDGYENDCLWVAYDEFLGLVADGDEVEALGKGGEVDLEGVGEDGTREEGVAEGGGDEEGGGGVGDVIGVIDVITG